MKTFILSATAFAFFATQALAQAPIAAKARHKREIHEPYLQVYVIDPPHPLDWKSPSSLLKTTLVNGLTGDYAPNGHLAVYLKARKPNAHGVTEILTGMGRTNKLKTLWDTLYRQYGLTAMIHEFEGDLDSAESTQEELHKALKAKRLSSIQIQLTDDQADQIFEFFENWIQYGSYRHYGGNKNVAKGEGSGCADFGTHFIQIALGGLPSDDWISGVYMPYSLLQEAPGRAPKKVSALEILRSNLPWAKSDKEGLYFSIPDPEKITKWIKSRSPYHKKAVIFPDEFSRTELASRQSLSPFRAPYPREGQKTIEDHWNKINWLKEKH